VAARHAVAELQPQHRCAGGLRSRCKAGWRPRAHQPHALHRLFERLRLRTLRLADTTPRGGWRNADGAGVGHLQMTAWDSLRLLWWLDPEAPPLPLER
jgi:hypothetical protein